MTNNKLKLTAYIGILASLIMFTGDMLLYFTTQEFVDYENELLASMGKIPFWRLTTGGLLGPLAAFLYIIGFYHITYAFKKPKGTISMTVFAILSLSVFFGGAFHAFFPAFGIASAQGNTELITVLEEYATYLALFTYILPIVAWVLIVFAILRKQTHYPPLMILATPMLTFWLLFVWRLLPQPFHIILAGGWSNLIMTVFFTVSLIVLSGKFKNK